MAARVKKAKERKEIEVAKDENESEEAVIEVKTTKKPTEGISSFSQLDSDKQSLSLRDKKVTETPVTGEDESEVETKDEADVESVSEDKEEVEEATDVKTEDNEAPEATQDAESNKSAVSSDEAKKWLKSVSPELETESGSEKGSKAKIFIVIIVIAIILGIIAGGFYYYRSKVSSTPEKPTQPSTSTETVVTPEPTEEPVTEEIDFSEYSVSILNGSGVPGEAGNAESLLSDLEFSSIDTGNAESYDYENTEVSLKGGLPRGIFTKIEEPLSEDYKVTLSETTLDEDSSFDIIIIVGSKK